jgi:pSer/pThr/pTyr-binding forkhead associated (FHA) protein
MEEWALILNNRVIKRFSIEEGQALTIGRGQDADITVDNSAISRQHSSLELKGGTYYLTDLYSLNGTKVNGKKIVSAVPIKRNDLLEISKFILKPAALLTDEEEAGSVSTSPEGMDQTIFVQPKAKAKSPAGQFTLVVTEGQASKESLNLSGMDSVKIGKGISCDLIISGIFVAKTQFFINRGQGGYSIIPQSGLRRVYLNGKKIESEIRLKKGDLIRVAGTTLKLS